MSGDADREEESDQRGPEPKGAQFRREAGADHDVEQVPRRVRRMQQGPDVPPPPAPYRGVVGGGERLRHASCPTSRSLRRGSSSDIRLPPSPPPPRHRSGAAAATVGSGPKCWDREIGQRSTRPDHPARARGPAAERGYPATRRRAAGGWGGGMNASEPSARRAEAMG